MLDRRLAAALRLGERGVVGDLGEELQPAFLAERCDRLSVGVVAHLVRHDQDLRDPELLREFAHPTRRLHRPVVRLEDREDPLDVPSRAAGEVLESRLHIHEDVAGVLALRHDFTKKATDRGVG